MAKGASRMEIDQDRSFRFASDDRIEEMLAIVKLTQIWMAIICALRLRLGRFRETNESRHLSPTAIDMSD